ncbi:MAG: MATE family efflux transporter, partial [Planctomycetota bacterium]
MNPLVQEIRAVVRLAVPVALSQLGMMLMGFVDTAMVGRFSEIDAINERNIAAVGIGHAFCMGIVVPLQGILFGLDPFISQAAGISDLDRVRLWRQRGLLLAVLLSIPVLLVAAFAPGAFFRMWRQPEDVVPLAVDYVRANLLGIVPVMLFTITRQASLALSRVRPVLWAVAIANIGNFGANWALVFGNLSLPALGAVGAGWATSLSRILLFVMIELSSRLGLREIYGQWTRRAFELRPLWSVLRIGLPTGFQIGLEYWVFAAVTLFMGYFGPTAQAGHQIALVLASTTFMVPLGVSVSATTRVGNAIGRGDQEAARRSSHVCLGLGALVMLVSATCFAVFPEPLSRLFSPSNERVVALAATLLPVAAVFQVFDGLQAVGAGVLRGTADTRVPATIALLGF